MSAFASSEKVLKTASTTKTAASMEKRTRLGTSCLPSRREWQTCPGLALFATDGLCRQVRVSCLSYVLATLANTACKPLMKEHGMGLNTLIEHEWNPEFAGRNVRPPDFLDLQSSDLG